ncbi:hypothetical protein [Rhizobium sp. BK176]|uniref:hypothetical protein n=1 Tax=Rhizobium sp. BK176 TaxID=2587071 RepID=UPI002166EBC8|nr:hypothetical protein [Rhizobium sp. BK176]MCS4090141.1 hypothetical protein [Rhizobium sp. BK176]
MSDKEKTMRLDIRLPIRFRAVTKRSPRERHVYCSKRLNIAVPELSRSEAEVAFRMRERNGDHQLITVNERLYRPLVTGNATAETVMARFGAAFSVLPAGPISVMPATEITRPDLYIPSPVRLPIEFHYHRQALLRRRGAPGDWPKGGTELVRNDNDIFLEETRWANTRNSLDFDALMEKLDTANEDDLELAERTHDAQLAKLVMIDGEPWYETRPPCVKVRADGSVYHVGFLPDYVDHHIGWQYFGVEELDALPFEFKPGVLPDGETFECHRPDLLAFDSLGLAARRTTSAVSIWTAQSLNDVRRWEARERQDIDDVAEDAVRWNELLGEGNDFAQHLEMAVDTWNAMGSPVDHLVRAYSEGQSLADAARLVCERYRDRPISLALGAPWTQPKP